MVDQLRSSLLLSHCHPCPLTKEDERILSGRCEEQRTTSFLLPSFKIVMKSPRSSTELSASRSTSSSLSVVPNQMAMSTCSSVTSIHLLHEEKEKSKAAVSRRSTVARPFHCSTHNMFGCVLNQTRAITLAIALAIGLILAATAIGLSIGLTQRQTKSRTTTG